MEMATEEANWKWKDEDDSSISVDLSKSAKSRSLKKEISEHLLNGEQYATRLRQNRENLGGRPKWVESHAETFCSLESCFEDEQLLPDIIELERLLDVTHSSPSVKSIISAHFHPLSSLVCYSRNGEDKVVFISLDKIRNPVIHEVSILGSNCLKSSFTADGRHVLITGGNRFIHLYDIPRNTLEKIQNIPELNESSWKLFECSPCGKIAVLAGSNGNLMILSLQTRRCMKILKMNSSATCLTISSDGLMLLAAGEDQNLYIWSLNSFDCIGKYSLNSGSKITSLALSCDMKHLAIGMHLGAVDIYNFRAFIDEFPNLKPWKSLMNLTTSIDIMKFHPSSQLLAIGSSVAWNCVRLVHIPSGRVFSNWPNSSFPVGHINNIDFSPDGTLLMLGSGNGKIKLFSLNHFVRKSNIVDSQ